VPTLIRQASRAACRATSAGENVVVNGAHRGRCRRLPAGARRRAPGSFFFIENGEANFKSIVASIARLLGGKTRPEGWSIDEAIAEWGPMAVWFSLGGNSRVNADKARRMLGWKPRGADLEHEIEKGWYRRQLEAGAYGSAARP
jgi:nucleoside-diphosphate-sugar epimerase